MTKYSVSAGSRLAEEPYMSRAQLHYLRNRLLGWRRELSSRLQEAPDETVAEPLADWVDCASLNSQRELSLGERARNLQIIRQIDAALARIKAGTYGYCAESGEEIGFRRLTIMPIARYSVEVQRDIERCQRRDHNRKEVACGE